MLTDITIWTAPSVPLAAGVDVAAGRGSRQDFTDADYVPRTYVKPLRSVTEPVSTAVALVSTRLPDRVPGAGRAQTGVELYASVFNYRDPPANRLSVYA